MQEMEARLTEDGKMIIEGYAIVYNKEAEIWGDIEIILPGAATEALKVEDQYYLWPHDVKSPLARKKSETLTVEEDEEGDPGPGVVFEVFSEGVSVLKPVL